MAWLLREDDVLAAVEDRRKGWQTSMAGAVVITKPAWVQTLTPTAAAELDIAWCSPGDGDGTFVVRRISVLPARRLAVPRLRPGALVVAPGGTFERWQLHVGDRLEVAGS